jgi:hypothetical protein
MFLGRNELERSAVEANSIPELSEKCYEQLKWFAISECIFVGVFKQRREKSEELRFFEAAEIFRMQLFQFCGLKRVVIYCWSEVLRRIAGVSLCHS